MFPRAVEVVYGRALFPVCAAVLGAVARLTRFSLAQMVLALATLALLWFLSTGARRALRQRSLRHGFGPGHRWLAALALVLWGFHLLWGFNYDRPTLRERMRLTAAAPDAARLARVTRALAHEANRSYHEAIETGEIDTTGDGPRRSAVSRSGASPSAASRSAVSRSGVSWSAASHLLVSRADVAGRLDSAYGDLQPALRRVRLAAPKFPAALGWLLTRVGISGFYSPFTGEATVNAELPDAEIPFTMAHEMAHQRGTAPEDEANFLGYLSCRESGLAAARYSGALAAWALAANALAQASPESLRALPGGGLDPGPRADRAAIHRFWERHEGRAARVSERVNDAYLKANAQHAGVLSYDRAVELLVDFAEAGGLDDSAGDRNR